MQIQASFLQEILVKQICSIAENMDSNVSQHVETAEEKVVEMQRTLFRLRRRLILTHCNT